MMSISVCIPTYNQGKFIEQTIRSVMAQTLRPNEIIVSNDHSTDQTSEVLERLAKEINILQIIHQPNNLGMTQNTNLCLRMAKGDIVVKLDSDDCLLPDYIKTLTGLLLQFPEAGYAHGAVQEIDENNRKVKLRRLFRSTGFYTSGQALKTACNGYQVAANIIMFRKEALEAVGYTTATVKFAEDYYLSVEIANAGYGNVYCQKVLSCYRVWGDSGNVRQRRKLDEINGLRIIFEKPMARSFARRGWNLRVLHQKRKKLACAQANCLMWTIYSREEKEELASALYNLSPVAVVKLYAFLYRNGFGNVLLLPSTIAAKMKTVIKGLVRR